MSQADILVGVRSSQDFSVEIASNFFNFVLFFAACARHPQKSAVILVCPLELKFERLVYKLSLKNTHGIEYSKSNLNLNVEMHA